MVLGAARKLVQKAMKGAGTKVPKLGTISSDIKKAEKKGDKATVKKLKRKKAKILKQKADISSKEKAKKDLAAKNKKTRIACVGNSSSGIKETAIFKCPTVNIGSRQKSRLRGSNVIDAGYKTNQIFKAVNQK